ncbi:MAG: hypothetical protein DLM69_01345, partial [Candidatus Chloroheliales bacterium]
NMNPNAGAQNGPDVSRFIEPDERILWQGQPMRGVGNPLRLGGMIVLGVGVLLGLIFGIVGFVLGNLSSEVGQTANRNVGAVFLWVGPLVFGIMVFTGATLLIAGRFISRNIAYVLTEQRAIIAQGPSFGATRTTLVDLTDVGIIRVLENKDGSGSIIFGRSSYYSSQGGYGGSGSYYDRDYSIANIPDVMNVYRLIR